ncbi:MAG: FG-GAP-like repeat-containing protein [Tepidisphaeraceae bacterium]
MSFNVANDPAGSLGLDVAVGNLGNGQQDIVTAGGSLLGSTAVDVYLNQGNGTFSTPTVLTAGGQPYAVALGAFTSSGLLDIAVTNFDDDTISVFLNQGNEQFGPAITTLVGSTPDGLAVADFNGDGNLDLVVANRGDNDVGVLFGNGNGTFKPMVTYPVGTDVGDVEVGDFNDDGHPDIVSEGFGGNGSLDVLLNQGNGTFGTAESLNPGGNPNGVTVADLGNTQDDLILGTDTGIFELTGAGNGTFSSPVSLAGNISAGAVTVGDYNGDGVPDLAYTDYSNQSINVLIGNSNGTFQTPATFAIGGNPYALASGDFNNDGLPDLAAVNHAGSDPLSVLLDTTPLTPTITQSGGAITGDGTAANDTATVSYSAGNVSVTIDGMSQSFAMSSVNAININLGAGNDTIMVSSGVPSVSINGGAGDDKLMAENTAVDTVAGGGGADTVMGGGKGSSLMGNAGDDMIVPANRHESVSGGGGNDTVSGAGHDSLAGGAGSNIFLDEGEKKDTINGGAGLNFAQNNPTDVMSKIYEVFDPPAPVNVEPLVIPNASNELVGGPLDATDAVTASVVDGELKVTGTSGADIISVSLNTAGTKLKVVGNGQDAGTFKLTGLTGIHVNGGPGADSISIDASVTLPATLLGNGGADSLAGGGGDNVEIGGPGGDLLIGGAGTNLLVPDQNASFVSGPAGNDTLDGGTGFSIADFSRRTDPLTLSNDNEADSGDSSQHEADEIMSNVSAIWGGTGGNVITGATGGEFLSGGAGANSIHGGGANDLLVGGGGNDTVIVAAEPVSLYLINGFPNQYGGVSNPSEDILQLDSLDTQIT